MREKIRIFHECEGGIEKSMPRITVRHHKACNREGLIFLSHLHMNNGFFFLLTIKYLILCLKKAPRRS